MHTHSVAHDRSRRRPAATTPTKAVGRRRRTVALAAVVALLFGSLGAAPGAQAAAIKHSAFVFLQIAPSGGGSVADDQGNSCDEASCTLGYGDSVSFDEDVTFTATPAPGMELTGWNGTGADSSTCTGTGTCILDIQGTQTTQPTYKLEAFFGPAPTPSASASASATAAPPVTPSPTATAMSTLTVAVTGAGSVTSQPTGIDCAATGGSCKAAYPTGAPVVLTAVPNSAAVFTGWGGACAPTTASGSTPAPVTCTVTMNGVQSVTAAFGPAPAAPPGTIAIIAPTDASALSQAAFAPSVAPGITVASYSWDFESTGHPSTCPASAPIAIHQFTHGGTFQVTLKVLDSTGQATTTTQTVTVAGPTTTDPLMGKSAVGNVACATPPPGWTAGGPIASTTVSQFCTATVQVDWAVATALDGCFHWVTAQVATAAVGLTYSPKPPPPARPVTQVLPKLFGESPTAVVQATNPATSPVADQAVHTNRGPTFLTAAESGGVSDRMEWEAQGAIDLDGLRIDSLEPAVAYPGQIITPPGGPILIDPVLDMLSAGQCRVTVDNSTAANQGNPITLADRVTMIMVIPDAPSPNTAVPFGGFDLSQLTTGLPHVHGFDIGGTAQTQLQGSTVTVQADINLPAPLTLADGSPVTATVTFAAVAGSGLQLQSFEFDATDVDLGPFVLNQLHVSYQAGPDIWQASGSVFVLDQATVSAAVEFQDGSLVQANGSLDDQNPGIGVVPPLLYLNKISFAIQTSPLAITGGVEFTAGGSFSTPFGDASAADLDGTLSYDECSASAPGCGPWSLTASGSMSVVGLSLTSGTLTDYGDGSVTFEGKADFNPFNLGIVQITASLKGGVYSNGTFDADVNAQFCVLWGNVCAGGEFVVSSKGFGACLALHGPFGSHLHIGGGLSWGHSPDIMWDSCGVGPWQVSAPHQESVSMSTVAVDGRALAASGPPESAQLRQSSQPESYSLTVPPGAADEQVIGVVGVGGAPQVTVTGPGGQSATSQPGQGKFSGKVMTLEVPQQDTTYVLLAQPAVGSVWTVTPTAESVPVTQVRHASGTPAPTVTATVAHTGSSWALHYAVTGGDGAPITFEEVGTATRQVLGTVTSASGVLPFTPGDGIPGTRTIQAVVPDPGGATSTIVPVATYQAPSRLLPAAPAALGATPDGTGLTVHWIKGTGGAQPSRYVVESRLSDGRSTQMIIASGSTTASIPLVYPQEHGMIKVAGLLADGTPGIFAVLTLPLAEPLPTDLSAWSRPWPYAACAVLLLAVLVGTFEYRRRRRSRA